MPVKGWSGLETERERVPRVRVALGERSGITAKRVDNQKRRPQTRRTRANVVHPAGGGKWMRLLENLLSASNGSKGGLRESFKEEKDNRGPKRKKRNSPLSGRSPATKGKENKPQGGGEREYV